MISVAEARTLAGQRLGRHLAGWATSPPEAPAWVLGLKPPAERTVRADELAAETWAREWAGARLPPGAEVDWESRLWRSIGRQRVPVRLRVESPDGVAAFAGGDVARQWRTLTARVAVVHEELGRSAQIDQVVRRHTSELLRWPTPRFDQVVGAAAWLARHDVVGLRPRQLPIRGVDTKWFAAHRSVLTALVAAATGSTDLGIVDADPLVRLRILDPALSLGGLTDLAAPVEQLRGLRLRPSTAFIFENLESVLAMPAWPGAVVLHGSGYAVDVVGELPWVRDAPVIYWGDLDSHGFAILHRLRAHLPEVRSVLMDEATLLGHRDLWVPDPKPTRGELPSLTAAEARARHLLHDEGDVRLEQERIPWERALAALQSVGSLTR